MNFDNYPVSLPPRYIFNDNQIDVSRFETASSGRYPSVRVRSNGRLSRQFPVKLHALLCSGKYEDIISWQPTGRSFIIYSPKEFVKSVMPKYFRQTKLRSFQRQLNLYDFKRVTEGADIGGYYHSKFLRGAPDLCKEMSRVPVKCKPRIIRTISDESSSLPSSASLLPRIPSSIITANYPIVTTPRINEMFLTPLHLLDTKDGGKPMQEPLSVTNVDHSPHYGYGGITLQEKGKEFQRSLTEVRAVSDECFDDHLSDEMSLSLELSAIDLDDIFDNED